MAKEMSTGDFYRAFEERYRGPRELIKSRLRVYIPFIEPLKSVYSEHKAIDLGCGRGEWLELLQELGYDVRGVDLDDQMLAACRQLGLKVQTEDAIGFLKALPNESQLVVSAFHLVEHIPFADLQTLVQEALRVLGPGGLLIMETPNPENIVVGTANFYLDPTHQRPIPPQLLSFLPEYYGFFQVKILRLQEPEELASGKAPSLLNVFNGVSPDYAVVAQKGGDEFAIAATRKAFATEYGLTLENLAARYDDQAESRATEAEARAQQSETLRLKTEADRLELHHHLAQLREEYNVLTKSHSWRITAPLRKLMRLLRWLFRYPLRLLTSNQQLRAHAHAHAHAHAQAPVDEHEKHVLASRLDESRPGKAGSRTIEAGSSGIKTGLKNRIARPLLLMVNRFLQPHYHLKQRISFWLFRNFPQAHHRLRRVIQQQAMVPEKAQRALVGRTTMQEYVTVSVLSDPNLASLERPTVVGIKHSQLDASSHCEMLEPVVELSQMRHSAATVCFVVSICESDKISLERTVQSVLRQTDPAWELIFCASGELYALAADWLDIDWRIRSLDNPAQVNDIQNVLRASIQATTQFVGYLAQGDVVDDDLVKQISQKVCLLPQADVIYTDEIYSVKGKGGEPFHKPDWSPEHQHSVNMLGRFLAIRKSLLLNLRLSESVDAEVAEYELGLTVSLLARQVAHIDDALYIRHVSSQGRTGGFFSKLALDGAKDVLAQHLRMNNLEAQVIAQPEMGSLHVRWPVPQNMPVTLLILTGMHSREISGRGNVVLATNFVRSIIENSTFKGYKIIVVDDGFVPDDLRALLLEHGHTMHTYPKEPTFSFARKANFATALVASGIVILLNDDLEVISKDWIEALVSQAARPAIGVVGGRLLYADGLIQHAGIAMGFHGSAGHMFHRAAPDGSEYCGFASIERNYSAVTGAVLAYRKAVFDEIGGFDEQFQTDYNDLDFCLKSVKQGYRVVYTPAATLYHFHNSSLKRMHDKDSERKAFLDRWQDMVDRDPYFSKHFQKRYDVLSLLDN